MTILLEPPVTMKNIRIQRARLLLVLILILTVLSISLNVLIYLWLQERFLLSSLLLPLILTLHYLFPSKGGYHCIATLAAVASLYLLWKLIFIYTLFSDSSLPTDYLALYLLPSALPLVFLFLIVYAARITSGPAQTTPPDASSVPGQPEAQG
ncbi:hypothetical protein [Herbaspirillum sp. C7C8]|uniref:hypothetical protein n=1 Tax=Herbaspirillum sp. C7C8 TaxID=2736665 RepID=UPI001F51CFCE|nr:hypothetical protein [Herbaspirillum sp. C7C8]MCI1004170.1 hypothetical protein [Herbaspirillum sp. C7C8]